jgi:hypothetical protein
MIRLITTITLSAAIISLPTKDSNAQLAEAARWSQLSPPGSVDESTFRRSKTVVVYYVNDVEAPTSDNINTTISRDLRNKLLSAAKSTAFTEYEQKALQDVETAIVAADRFLNDDTITDRRTFDTAVNRGDIHAFVEIRNFANCAVVENPRPGEQLFRELSWSHRQYIDGEVPKHFVETLRIPFELGSLQLKWSPLSHPGVFAETLAAVSKFYDPKHHQFVLIIRSRTTRDHVLCPSIAIDVREINTEKLARCVLDGIAGTSFLGLKTSASHSDNPSLKSSSYDLSKAQRREIVDTLYGVINDKLYERFVLKGDSDQSKRLIGTSKLQFLNEMMRAGGGDPSEGMYFSRVVLAGPNGHLELSTDPELRKLIIPGANGLHIRNLGRIYTRSADVPPAALSTVLAKAMGPQGKGAGIVVGLDNYLIPPAGK